MPRVSRKDAATAAAGKGAGATRTDNDIDLRAHLGRLKRARLVDLLVELSDDDELLRSRLELEAAEEIGLRDPRQLRQLKLAIDHAVVTRGFVSWREAYSYAMNIRSTLEMLRRLLDEGKASAVIELAEHALRRLEEAVGSVDDSDGELGGVATDLQLLHLEACTAARPESVALARRLFEWELNAGDLDVFSGAASTYATVLGETGGAEYRRLAEAEWERLPQLAPNDQRSFTGVRFRVTHIMETLAEASGDVDAMVGVLAKDQSSPWQYVRIAETLREHGRDDEAIAWAERGVAAFGPSADPRLTDLLADSYQRAGRPDDAVTLAWRAFDEAATPAAYQRLAHQARLAQAWDTWRERGLNRLRAEIGRRSSGSGAPANLRRASWAPRADASDLVEVLVCEGETEQAWVEAKTGGCSNRLWVELARRREGEHPGDAIPIWQAEVERSIDMKRNDAYAAAVELMHHVRSLMRDAGQHDSFAPYAAAVAARHKAKRNFIKLFEASVATMASSAS